MSDENLLFLNYFLSNNKVDKKKFTPHYFLNINSHKSRWNAAITDPVSIDVTIPC